MRADLRKKVMERYWKRIDSVVLPMKLTPEQKKVHNLFTRKSQFFKIMQKALMLMPDEDFEKAMAMMDRIPDDLKKNLKGALSSLPKSRGGRTPAFSLEIRRRAVQDIGHEYPNCNSLAEAIGVVAERYKMTPEYLHKVWKNRKRLRQREA